MSEYSVHTDRVDIKTREIFITGEDNGPGEEPGVEYLMAGRLIRNLRILRSISCKPILIHMQTCGGDWDEGMAMFDAIKYCGCHTTILAYTHARSMSSIILQAATRRVMMPHAYFMFHNGSLEARGEFQRVISQMQWEENTKETMLQIYATRLTECKTSRYYKYDTNEIKTALSGMMDKKGDVFMTPKTAFEWGFIDSIFDGKWNAL